MTDEPQMKLGLGRSSITVQNAADGSKLHADAIGVWKNDILPTDIILAYRTGVGEMKGKPAAWVIPEGKAYIVSSSGRKCAVTREAMKEIAIMGAGGELNAIAMFTQCFAAPDCSVEKIINPKKGNRLNPEATTGISYYALNVNPISFNSFCPDDTPKTPTRNSKDRSSP